ncbi:cadherin-3-like [Engraulis encrasicolus]|uniref:cadherin-3-like n=1 Tax=Engraulis encrasicolus TaxID=184585 RepID=UPI002FD47B2C
MALYEHNTRNEGKTSSLALIEIKPGTIEILERPEGADLILESPSCPVCASFLTLAPVRSSFATVLTTKPLDADVLEEHGGVKLLSYYIKCESTGVMNPRTLPLIDINDHAPVFEKDVYQVEASKSLPVDYKVVQVKATDADANPVFNTVTYSIEPPSDTFDITSEGWIVLKKSLDYAITNSYTLTVIAKDIDSKMDDAIVMISVTDVLYFQHRSYYAYILENEMASLYGVHPEPIQALGVDKEEDQIIYGISTVNPDQYWEHFGINTITGVITVLKKLDHEEESMITLGITASQENDSERTATATVEVEVTDVNEAPEFSQPVYEAYTFTVVPIGFCVINVKATDPDVGETDTLRYSVAEPSSQFTVDPSSGQVCTTSYLGSEKVTTIVNITVLDARGLDDFALVKVEIHKSEKENIASLSINVNHDAVKQNEEKVKQVLEKHISSNVTIIDISPLEKASSYWTYIDVVAMVDSSILHQYVIDMRLEEHKPAILEELQGVFGPDTDFDVVTPGDKGGMDNSTILLATLLPAIAFIIAFIALPRMRDTLKEKIKDASAYAFQSPAITASSTHVPVNRSKQCKRIGRPHPSGQSNQWPNSWGILSTILEHPELDHPSSMSQDASDLIDSRASSGYLSQGTTSSTLSSISSGSKLFGPCSEPESELDHLSSVSKDAKGLIDTRKTSSHVSQGTTSSTLSNISSDSASTQNATLREGSLLFGPRSEPTERKSVRKIFQDHHPKPELDQPSICFIPIPSGSMPPPNGSLKVGSTLFGPSSDLPLE